IICIVFLSVVNSMEEEKIEDIEENEGQENEKKVKKRKPGIIYLSSIPANMNVSQIRKYFSDYGQLNRVFLQAASKDKMKGKSKKKGLKFTEGWIEYKSKRKAKMAFATLNSKAVGGKKSNPDYDVLWNIKYLPRFKWAYLKQRLEYEREVHRQRMNIEVGQVRREADHFVKASEWSHKLKKEGEEQIKENASSNTKNKKKGKTGVANNSKEDNFENNDGNEKKSEEKSENNNGNEKNVTGFVFKQKLTEEEIQKRKEAKRRKNEKYKKLIEKRKKKKQENHNKKQKPVDDLIGSIFVGS
ncbi:unnamed protein product, partial [Meganyctiphanes norvegica]